MTDLLVWWVRHPEWAVGLAHWVALVALIVLGVAALALGAAKLVAVAALGAFAWRILRGSVAAKTRRRPWKGRHSPQYIAHVQQQSPAWRAIRAGVLRRAGDRCEQCGAPGPLDAHHLTYERLGHERLSDCVALCPRCHKRAHARRPAQTTKTTATKRPTTKRRTQPKGGRRLVRTI